jgi:hypothetical protein
MKNALISPNEQVQYISSWEPSNTGFTPVYTVIPNSERVAEVSDTSFEVAPPLFWVDCADNVIADVFYYDSVSQAIIQTPEPAPIPDVVQPISQGSQTL